jgi:hypothetical protein
MPWPRRLRASAGGSGQWPSPLGRVLQRHACSCEPCRPLCAAPRLPGSARARAPRSSDCQGRIRPTAAPLQPRAAGARGLHADARRRRAAVHPRGAPPAHPPPATLVVPVAPTARPCTTGRAGTQGAAEQGLLKRCLPGCFSAQARQAPSPNVRVSVTQALKLSPAAPAAPPRQVLAAPIIQARIAAFLSQTIHEAEFSHTIIHGQPLPGQLLVQPVDSAGPQPSAPPAAKSAAAPVGVRGPGAEAAAQGRSVPGAWGAAGRGGERHWRAPALHILSPRRSTAGRLIPLDMPGAPLVCRSGPNNAPVLWPMQARPKPRTAAAWRSATCSLLQAPTAYRSHPLGRPHRRAWGLGREGRQPRSSSGALPQILPGRDPAAFSSRTRPAPRRHLACARPHA